jgi:tetratricopeptide (TPR) repeat protein
MTLVDLGGLILVILTMVLLHYAGLILHELGHLVCARAMGWQPVRLAIGIGHRLGGWQVGDLKVTFGSQFTSGYVQVFPRARAGYRGRRLLLSAAGPFASALFIIGLGVLAQNPPRWHAVPGLETGLIWVFLAECFFLATNLWPRTVRIDNRWVPNDGLSMWRTLFARSKALDHEFAAHMLAQVAQVAPADPVKALALIARTGGMLPVSNLEREVMKIAWLFPYHAGAARAEWSRLEQTERIGETGQADILDSLACIPLFYGLAGLIPEALAAIDRALALDPERITLRGTKGSLLIESDEVDAGERMLHEVQVGSRSENDQAICAWYLALAQNKKGNGEEAARQLRAAKEKYPNCVVSNDIERKIAGRP